MDKAAARRFIEKYAAGEHTEAEHQAFHEWLLSKPLAEIRALLEGYSDLLQQGDEYRPPDPVLLERIERRITEQHLPGALRAMTRRWWFFAAAAAAVLLIVGGYWTLSRQRPVPPAPVTSSPVEIQPEIFAGGDKAILILADGSKITLDEAAGGTLAKKGHTNIVKLDNGELVYRAGNNAGEHTSNEVLFNTIETPRGGQYQLTLSDGTKVWLNAASSLRYPTSFTGPERTVFLKGEAYFEVTSSSGETGGGNGMPFHVEVDGMNVSVLGTHFNIMAYENERNIQTTLLEGRVQVSSVTEKPARVELVPGQQASLDKATDNIRLANANTGEVTAWKNGYFQFNRADTYSIMRQIARWYDVEVVYEGTLPRDTFVGKISRGEPLSSVLRIFELSNIDFRLDGRKIIVKGTAK